MRTRDLWRELLHGLAHTVRTAIEESPAPVERLVRLQDRGVDIRYRISARVGLVDRVQGQPQENGGTSG